MLFSKKNDSVDYDSVDYQFFVVVVVARLNRPYRGEIDVVVYPGRCPRAIALAVPAFCAVARGLALRG